MKRVIAFLLLAAVMVNLTGCFGGLFGTEETEAALPYEGHYLVDLYEPYDGTRDKYDSDRFSGYVTVKEDITMAYEQFHKGIRFAEAPNDGEKLYLDYDIGGKYENISFFYGMDMSTPWQAENVAFQVIDPDTKTIIWEDLFEVGDIPRFVTVNIKGMEKLRLQCINKAAGEFCMTDITLWEGESEARDRTYPKVTQTTMLEDDYKFYYTYGTFTLANSYPERNFGEGNTTLSIKGQAYDNAALISFGSSFFDTSRGDDLYMNLRGQFKQIAFTWGLSDHQVNSVSDQFKGWISVYADGVCVLDEFECTAETPVQEFILDVNYAWQLQIVTRGYTSYNAEFCLAQLRGGENLSATPGPGTSGVVPLVRTYPPYFLSEATMARAKVYDNSTRYSYFSMGGERYCEGIVLQPVWDMINDFACPAYAITDLEGQHKYITFTMGHVDSSPYKDAVVEIYLDDEDEPSYTFQVGDTDLPKEYTVEVRNCRTIKFLCSSVVENNLPTVGIANIVCYPGEVVENDIFPPYYTEYPAQCELLEYFDPFGYCVSELEKPYYTDGVYDDGMYFKTVDGTTHKKGLLFCTRTGVNWDKVGWVGYIGAILTGTDWGMAGEAATGTTVDYVNSFYLFNVDGQYDTLTFKTAKVSELSDESIPTYRHPEDPEAKNFLQYIKIYGDSDDASIYSCKLIDGNVQEHTVDISGMDRIIFCVPNNEHLVSEVYAAFDITLSKSEG